MRRSLLDLHNRYGWVSPAKWFRWVRQRKRWGFCEADVVDMCSYVPHLIADMIDYLADEHDAVSLDYLAKSPDDPDITSEDWLEADRMYAESFHELARNLRYWNDYRDFTSKMSEKDEDEYWNTWMEFIERLPKMWT